jgi:hypothetical protein
VIDPWLGDVLRPALGFAALGANLREQFEAAGYVRLIPDLLREKPNIVACEHIVGAAALITNPRGISISARTRKPRFPAAFLIPA